MQNSFHDRILLNLERLRILRDLALTGANFEVVYDRLTRFASKVIDAPVSLVSMVAADYQFFKSHVGLPEPWKSNRRTPLSHSFCQHVVVNNEPLIVEDAREDDLLKNNQAIPDLNVIGYLGFPLTLSSNTSLGSFCVIDDKPHQWTEVEIDIMRELSQILIYEFETRAQINMRKLNPEELKRVHQAIDTLITSVDADAEPGDILKQIKSLRVEYQLQ